MHRHSKKHLPLFFQITVLHVFRICYILRLFHLSYLISLKVSREDHKKELFPNTFISCPLLIHLKKTHLYVLIKILHS
jgi:hypothetical protein